MNEKAYTEFAWENIKDEKISSILICFIAKNWVYLLNEVFGKWKYFDRLNPSPEGKVGIIFELRTINNQEYKSDIIIELITIQ